MKYNYNTMNEAAECEASRKQQQQQNLKKKIARWWKKQQKKNYNENEAGEGPERKNYL